jgi:glucan phosphorylase
MRQTVFRELHQLYPDRIVNKTNGITLRRWLFAANPRLTGLLTEVVGERVLDDAEALAGFAKAADDTAMHDRLAHIRRDNKQALARLVAERLQITLDPDALFDAQIKRVHEYKRQLLNILETIALYNDMRARHHVQLGATGEDLRRQGGRQLSPCQADHQADQRRGECDQQRPGVGRAAEGGVHSRLQCQPGGSDHSRRRRF